MASTPQKRHENRKERKREADTGMVSDIIDVAELSYCQATPEFPFQSIFIDNRLTAGEETPIIKQCVEVRGESGNVTEIELTSENDDLLGEVRVVYSDNNIRVEVWKGEDIASGKPTESFTLVKDVQNVIQRYSDYPD